jgi:YhcH/YjgK/YiaL family protein
MILDEVSRLSQYSALSAGVAQAAGFLAQAGLSDWPDGSYAIDGSAVYAIISRGQGKGVDEAVLEVHKRYIDIQVVLQGEELQGWKSRLSCRHPLQDYDPNRDCRFFADPPDVWFKIRAGQFSLFFPEDAHAPMISPGLVHKVVIKVACSDASD